MTFLDLASKGIKINIYKNKSCDNKHVWIRFEKSGYDPCLNFTNTKTFRYDVHYQNFLCNRVLRYFLRSNKLKGE